jgi:hypothetical protein
MIGIYYAEEGRKESTPKAIKVRFNKVESQKVKGFKVNG